jgi:hypothetical protein
MLHCIAGAIMACSNYAGIYIDGPLGSNYKAPVTPAFNYALYAVPLQQPMPVFFPVTRRG